MIWTYKTHILSALNYGGIVWANHKLTKATLDKMKRLQRLASYSIAAIKSSTPQAGIEVILGLPPIDLTVERRGLEAYIRNEESIKSCWDGIGFNNKRGHLWKWREYANSLHVDPKTDEKKVGWRWNKPKRVSTPSPKLPTLYLDGSKLSHDKNHLNNINVDSKGGVYSFVFTSQETENETGRIVVTWKEKPNCDLKALKWAGDFLMDKCGPDKEVNLITGLSISALSMNKLKRKSQHDMKDSLDRLQLNVGRLDRGSAIKRDDLKRLMQDPNTQTIDRLDAKPSWTGTKKQISVIFRSKWNKAWSDYDFCRQTKNFFPSVIDHSKYFSRLPRKRLSNMIQFITGHCNGNRHQSLVTRNTVNEIDPECRLCLEGEEDPEHLLRECPGLRTERRRHFGFDFASKGPIVWTPARLDGFLRESGISFLFV